VGVGEGFRNFDDLPPALFVAPTAAAPMSAACSTVPNMTWSNWFGSVRSSL